MSKMKHQNKGGVALIYTLVLCLMLNFLFFYAFMRTDVAMEQVRGRYLEGIALDLAENGIEKAKVNISHGNTDPTEETIGEFAGNAGLLQTEVSSLSPNSYKISSTGKLIAPSKKTLCQMKVTAHLKLLPDGSWKTIKWQQDKL